MKATLLYGLVCAALIGGAWAVLERLFTGPGARHALIVSAELAFGVQVIGFVVARAVGRAKDGSRNLIVGWALTALLRLATLVVYAWAFVQPAGMPMAPALVGLAVFLFVTMVIEPLLLQL